MRTSCGGVVLLLLWPLLAEAAPLQPREGSTAPIAPPSEWDCLLRLEVITLSLLAREGVGARQELAQVEPTLVLSAGSEWGLNLGAPVRWRLGRGAGVRRQDWDSRSDWGQWVRGLKLGSDSAPWSLWVGGLESYSLLSGHLVRRYSNRLHPDDHPAGGFVTGTWGPLYAQAFTSDVLEARLVGAEAALDVEHLLSGLPRQRGRYTLALSAVRDRGHGGEQRPSATAAHLDGTAVVVARHRLEAHLLAGWGGWPGHAGAWGAVAGVGADAVTPTLDLKLRLEARRQHGGFRQGTFGPDYEWTLPPRMNSSGVPLAPVPFPDGFSLYAEGLLGWDAVKFGGLQRHLKLSLAAEAFSWGRMDVDGRVSVQLFSRNLEVAVKALAVGLGKPAGRSVGAAEVRWRLHGGALYVLAAGGTQLVSLADGALRPQAFASAGLGVDNAR